MNQEKSSGAATRPKPTARRSRTAALIALATAIAPTPLQSASAQQATPPPPPTQAIDAPSVERLFGDWAGAQTNLLAHGVSLQLGALTEFAGNISGGAKQGSTFANQVGLNLDINWERLAHVTGLSTHLIVVNRSGSSDSALFGDNLLPVQEVYGSGGDVALHLVSIYAEETLFDRALDIEFGRMNVENDFASSSLYCNFMNNALCGDPKALPGGDIGHSAYPDAVWATRVRVRPTPDSYAEIGIYEVNQGLYSNQSFRSGFKFSTAQDSGVYIPVELAWEPHFGPNKLAGHYKLGFGYDTSGGHADFTNALADAGIPGYRDGSHRGNTQFWALADQMLIRQGSDDTAGVIALAGLIENDPNNTAYAAQYFAGVVDRGFWPARPKDAVGLLFTYVSVSNRLSKVQSLQQALALPLSNGATGIQSNETILEANYNIHVADGLSFQPDFQYVLQPNAQRRIKDAAVFGFRASVQF